MAKPKKQPEGPFVPPPAPWVRWVQHGAPALVFGLFAILWTTAPEIVTDLGQEDSWIEWLTVAVFGAAAVAFALIGIRRGGRDGWFAWGLALFCFLVAGEELSWGQRLVGFTPPELFLEKNYQNEANVHNLFTAYLKTKWIVAMILAGWGIVLPALRGLMGESWMARLGVIAPPLALAPWCLAGIVLVIQYPLDMTAEWVELAAGLLFLVTALPLLQFTRVAWLALFAPVVAVVLSAAYLNLQDMLGSPQKLACAQAETRALAAAIEAGSGRTRLFARGSVDQRVYTTIQKGYLDGKIVEALDTIACEGVSSNPDRRRYGMDPWGQAYWLYFKRDADRRSGTALFYSFGPNRRYDSPNGKIEGTDDIGTRSLPIGLETRLAE